MKEYIISIKAAWSEVFSRTSYIVSAAIISLATFAFAVLLPNFALLNEVVLGSSAPIATKLNLTLSLLGGIRTNFSVLSATYTILIAILVGINAVMIVYLLRKRAAIGQKSVAFGVSGVASGALGVGCAACGSFLLSTILASFGAGSVLAVLLLKGGEFGVLSVALLGATLDMTSKKIAEPLVCNPENNNYDHE